MGSGFGHQAPQGPRPLSAQVRNGSIYLQVRIPQLQYPDFKQDNKPLANIPDFASISADAIANPSALLQKQVIYVDNSPQQQQVTAILNSNRRFSDDLFPSDEASLIGAMSPSKRGYKERKQLLAWRSIFDVIPHGDLFTGGIKPIDIHQGAFGNCYFLVGLSALAERLQRIRDIFLKK